MAGSGRHQQSRHSRGRGQAGLDWRKASISAADPTTAATASPSTAAEALWDARVIEFQRELLNNIEATPADHDWDDLAVLVYEDEGFPEALFEVLHSNPELKISKIIRQKAENMAEQWREDNQ